MTETVISIEKIRRLLEEEKDLGKLNSLCLLERE